MINHDVPKKFGTSFYVLVLIIVISLNTCTYTKLDPPLCNPVNSSYSKSIAPLIQSHCAITGCHNGGPTSVGNYNNYLEIKARVDNGKFKIRVIDTKTMPPISQPPLTDDEYTKLKCWYDAGAQDN